MYASLHLCASLCVPCAEGVRHKFAGTPKCLIYKEKYDFFRGVHPLYRIGARTIVIAEFGTLNTQKNSRAF
jgi:hypothetical protein